jgi:glycolate oxidase iron-sulfur subunit
MQTNFTKKQLADPMLAGVDRILRSCVNCGLCTAACPTYVLLGDERDSPRGRIVLMKGMFERGRRASAEIRTHIDRCLSCLACTTVCPAGVDYRHLVDHARAHVEKTGRRGFKSRLVRRLLGAFMPHPARFRAASVAATIAKPLLPLLDRLRLDEVAAMIALAPRHPARTPRYRGPGTAQTRSDRRGRVILLAGCAQQVLRPEINDAMIRLFARRGIDVEVASAAGCCGALAVHLGRASDAHRFAKRNIEAWSKALAKSPADAIVANTPGCATTVKDYGYLMHGVPGYAEPAERISELASDIGEFLSRYDLGAPRRWSSLRVAYHPACATEHPSISGAPKRLLWNAGFTVLDIPEGQVCCGAAGLYNILQPALARRLRDRKVENLASVRPDLVATDNIGCITQLAGSLAVPIVHTVELLDWAHGGPVPRDLEHLQRFVGDVPETGTKRGIQDYIRA